jgi:type IV pilus assembly protein PilV
MRHRPRAQRGLTLLEALVALVILAFSMLGLVGMQARLLGASTDAQHRVLAAALADRLLSHAVVDPTHAACYVLPAPPPDCSSAMASAIAAQWQADVAQLPDGAASAALLTLPMAGGAFTGSQQQLRVQLQWTGKSGTPHRVEATTDVR